MMAVSPQRRASTLRQAVADWRRHFFAQWGMGAANIAALCPMSQRVMYPCA